MCVYLMNNTGVSDAVIVRHIYIYIYCVWMVFSKTIPEQEEQGKVH